MTKASELDMMTIRDLRIIVYAGKVLSFSETAKQFGISRSNVSRIINNYERALGVTLFNRPVSGTRLTPVGKAHIEDLHFTLLYFDTKCAKLETVPAARARN